MGSLVGKVAVVTGASRGVGKGIALALADQGATVYVTGRTVGFSDLMVDGVAFVVRDALCSAIQWVVLIVIVRWFWTTARSWPTPAFVRSGAVALLRTPGNANPQPPVVRDWRRSRS